MSKTKNKKGMTLLEVIVVISIIGILSAVSIVSFSTYKINTALDSASREVVAVLREAQNYSLSGKQISAASGCSQYIVNATNSSSAYLLRNSCSSFSYGFNLKNGVNFTSGGDFIFDAPHGKLGSGSVNFFRIKHPSSGSVYYICINGSGLITRQLNSSCP